MILTVLRKPLIRRDKGDTLSLLVQLLSPGYLVLPLCLLVTLYLVDYLGWQLLDQPFLVSVRLCVCVHLLNCK